MDCNQTLQTASQLTQGLIDKDRIVIERKLSEFANLDLSQCFNLGARFLLNSNASSGTIQYNILG